jgi:hypothetical protein
MPTLEYYQASAEITKLADAIDVLDKALDRLWPKLPHSAMQKLSGVPTLELIDRGLAKRLREIASDIQDEGDAHVANEEETSLYA